MPAPASITDVAAPPVWTAGLKDGSRVLIRVARPEDAPLVQEFVRGLSPRARSARYFNALRELPPRELERVTRVDYWRRLTLIALHAEAGAAQIAGMAEYAAEDDTRSEIGLAVTDRWQRRGLGERLLRELLELAELSGFARIGALVLEDNAAMLGLAAKLGFTPWQGEEPGTVRIEKWLGARLHARPRAQREVLQPA
jgi:acetyltransferase